MSKTTIQIDTELKALLEQLKVHPREPYSDVIARLISLKSESAEEFLKTLDKVQKEKMRELWDNEADEVWNNV
jgi:predicted CopG family antitoxin